MFVQKKTEVLLQRTGHDAQMIANPQIKIGENQLKEVQHFTYLGSILSSDCSLEDDITRRIALASAAFGKLSRRVFNNHNLTLNTKRSVYQAACLSILLYGCEAWAPYKHQVRKLESFHMKCLKRILGLHWWDKVPHVTIRDRVGIPSLEEILLTKQLRYTGHIIRQPDFRLPRITLYSALATGRRSVGGQKKRFKDHLKSSIKRFNLNPSTLETDASDRTQWRTRVRNGARHFGIEYNNAANARRARRHQLNQGPHICDVCRRGCASRAGLRSHQKIHQRR